MQKLKDLWQKCQHHAHVHHRAYKHTHHGMYLCYLGTLTFHGPYTIVAGALLVLLIIGWILHLE